MHKVHRKSCPINYTTLTVCIHPPKTLSVVIREVTYPRKFAMKTGHTIRIYYTHIQRSKRTKSLLNLFDQVTENFPKCFTATVSFFLISFPLCVIHLCVPKNSREFSELNKVLTAHFLEFYTRLHAR